MDGSRADSFDMNRSGIVPIVPGQSFTVGDVDIDTVRVPHDTAEPTAFSVRYKGIKVTQLTDLGWIPDHVADWMKGSHVLILESNHDLDMLRVGPYPWSLKERLVGRNGHLSNATVGRYLRGPLDGQTQHIVLAHLSSTNNHPEIARMEACHALSARGLAEASVSVASQGTPSTTHRIRLGAWPPLTFHPDGHYVFAVSVTVEVFRPPAFLRTPFAVCFLADGFLLEFAF